MKNSKKTAKQKFRLLIKQSRIMVDKDFAFFLECREFIYKNRRSLDEGQIEALAVIISNLDNLLKGDFCFNFTDDDELNKIDFDLDGALEAQIGMKKFRDECYLKLKPIIDKFNVRKP